MPLETLDKPDSLAAQQSYADKYYGFPPGTMRALAMSESTNGTKLGSLGNTYQVEPSTALKPGYGLASVNGNDTMSVGAYLSALLKGPAAGNMASAMSMYQTGAANPKYTGANPAMSAYLSGVKYQSDPANGTAAANSNAPTAKPPPSSVDFDRVTAAVLGYGGSNERRLADDRARLDILPRMPVLAPPPQQPPPTDLLQAFGQPAMWIAIFGSLLTRRPLTTAIQAAAGVMKGTQDQNAAIVRQNYEEWKVSSENAVKLARFEQESYRDALELYRSDAQAGEAQFKTLMEAYQAAGLKYVYDTEGMPGVVKYLKKSGADTALLAEHQLKLDEELRKHAEKEAEKEAWKANHPNAGAQELNAAMLTIDAGHNPDADKGASANWSDFTDTKTGFQGYKRIVNDKPQYMDLSGHLMDTPGAIAHVGAAPAAGSTVAERQTRFDEAKKAAQERGDYTNDTSIWDAVDKAVKYGAEVLPPDALADATREFRLTGKMPSLGLGSPIIRQQILVERSRQLREEGGSVASDIARQSDVHSLQQALTTLARSRVNVSNFESTAMKEADLTLGFAHAGVGGGVPLINRWIQAKRSYIQGDPQVTNFVDALTSFKNEYARIMSSPTATGGQTTDAARSEADTLINNAMNLSQIEAAISTMKIGMRNRIKSINEEYDATKNRIEELGSPGGGARSGGDATQPIEGKIYTDKHGNRAVYRNGKFEEIP